MGGDDLHPPPGAHQLVRLGAQSDLLSGLGASFTKHPAESAVYQSTIYSNQGRSWA